MWIATKGGGDRAGTLECIKESQRRLNIATIDLWQFHGINTFVGLERVLGLGGGLEGAQAALQAGQIRHIGFSSHSLKVALKAVASGHFETVQFPLNFVSDEAADELLPLAQEHDMGFIAMKPFAGGRIQKANLAIKYLLQFENVVPDPGIEKVEEIEEIVGIVNSGDWELTDQERQEVGEIRARVGTRFCRQCEYCMPYTGCAYLWCAVSQDFVGTVAARNVFLWTVYWGICGSRCRECRGLHRVWRV